MNKTRVILNAAASTASIAGSAVRRHAKRHNCGLRLLNVEEDLETVVGELVEQETSRIVVAGGDGTISKVVRSLMPRSPHVEVGIVPLGTGNDLARSLDIPLDDLDRAFEIAVTRDTVPVDVFHATNEIETYGINAASGGFGGEVTATLSAMSKHAWGPFAYWMAAMAKLADLHGFDLKLEMDGDVSHHRVYGIALANGRYVGGGFPIAATALLNDGLLDVVMVPEVPKLELLAAGVNFMLGWESGDSPVVVRRARRVQVHAVPRMMFSLDGDSMSIFDATFTVCESAIRIAAGDRPALIP